MARKLRGFERVLDAPALFAVAYGEIASSLYIALGIVAAQALGLTPLVLLLTGALFLVVSLSYAEGTAAIPEAGGAATFVRRAFNDLAGFVTGWALFLDFLIVMALSALFVPHYLAAAIAAPSLRDSPWDTLIGCGLIAAIALIRLFRHSRLHVGALGVALLDLVVQGLLVVLGIAFVLSPDALGEGLGLASSQDWGDLAFALPLAMLAYTGLETAANLAEETREPGRTFPRSLFSAIGLVVLVTVLIAAIGLSAYPAAGGETALGDEWLEAPLVGIAAAFEGQLPGVLVDMLRIAVGVSGVLILIGAVTTSVSGITRLTYSLAEHGSLPRKFARLERRALVSSEAIVIASGLAIGAIVLTEVAADGDPTFLASAYSFGVLLAFTAAQLAVIRLRVSEPELTRPYRARPDVSHPRTPDSRARSCRRSAHVRHLGARAHDARGRPICRPALACVWRRAVRAGAALGAPWAPRARAARRAASDGCRVQAHPRSHEARGHRRGDGCDRDGARQGGRRRDRGDHCRPGAASVRAHGGAPDRRRREGRGLSRRGSAARRGSRSRGPARTSCTRVRSATRSSRKLMRAAWISSSSARRPAGDVNRGSSRPPSTSSCGVLLARFSWSRSPTESSRSSLTAP